MASCRTIKVAVVVSGVRVLPGDWLDISGSASCISRFVYSVIIIIINFPSFSVLLYCPYFNPRALSCLLILTMVVCC